MNKKVAELLLNRPIKFAHKLGFDKLGEIHNDWIREMVQGKNDYTLQAHRGSYKTTCVSIALALIIILRPTKRTMFMRKTDSDVKEVVKQVQKILEDPKTQYLVNLIYGTTLKMPIQSATEITTNLAVGATGTSQLLGIGSGSSITGKHYDFIFTDDIININDRKSAAAREETKRIYQELQNVKNQGGKIFNTGTPWHKEDCFSIMPPAHTWDCYQTGILSNEEINERRLSMSPSLFAANYELRHIPSEKVIFLNPKVGADISMVEQGTMHVDSAFYGEDYTSWTIMSKHDGKFFIYGKIRREHVQDCYDDIMKDFQDKMCGKMFMEDNADKGMVAKELRKLGAKVVTYHESQNKYIKIVTHLKAIWEDVIFVDGTDKEYIEQIVDYYEDAAHDDAPDSAASLARIMSVKKSDNYKPLWN